MRIGFLLAGIIITGKLLMGQSSDRMSRPEYFETYKEMAIREMHRSGVPASITLAQGALESGDGNSTLARNANNHFGIKCHNDWTGKKVYQDDDARNECFRKYPSVEESYRDHSDYLKTKQRYAFLFELDLADYKGWARGLKKAGYATSPTYADKLIDIIEEFDLQKYDRMDAGVRGSRKKPAAVPTEQNNRPVLEKNRVKYVVARSGDTFESLTSELEKLDWELPKYNDIKNGDTLVAGQVVFIQPKRNKAEAGKNVHVLQEQETMYTVSQYYAIKLSSLYAMNAIVPGTKVNTGTILQLRKARKGPVVKPVMEDIPKGGEEEEEIKVELNY